MTSIEHRPHRPSRRHFLGGAAVAIGLPWLEALQPRAARAAEARKRLLFYYVPNGLPDMSLWTPKEQGAAFTLPLLLSPLAALKDDITVISGLRNAAPRGNDGGPHAEGTGAFLTCTRPLKSGVMNGISVDQVAAQAQGGATRFDSLQLGIEGGAVTDICEDVYSCNYQRTISWSSPTTAIPKMVQPQAVFDRLFQGMDPGASVEELARRQRYKKSVLDYTTAQATSLRARLGGADQRKLDEYLTGVRAMEKRVAAATAAGQVPGGACGVPARPTANSYSTATHVNIMTDLMVAAMQCDATRIITFMLANGGSSRAFPFLSVQGQHHQLSHQSGQAASMAALQKIAIWEMQMFAALLTKMKAVDEGGASMLDNAAVFISSEIGDGNRHNYDNLPVILAGRAGGYFASGRHLKVATDTPLANLYLTMLHAAGVQAPRFADSTGVIDTLRA